MTFRLRSSLFIAASLVLLALPAKSCGPDFAEAIFVLKYSPGNYASFAGGKLGVIQLSYFPRTLAIAYDWLSGRPLSVDEQKQAVAANDYMLASRRFGRPEEESMATSTGATTPDPVQSWITARGKVSASPSNVTQELPNQRNVPKSPYQTFDNCLDDAYRNATRTLQNRVAHYGAQNPEVLEWVRGQDAVFSNCAGGGYLPQPASTGSLWLRQDRVYQIAAAQFYAMDYPAALQDFRSIAQDTASPWSPVSRYLVARTILRQTTMADQAFSYGETPDQVKTDIANSRQGYLAAQKELNAMRSDPHMASMRNAIDDLLDLVNARLQPDAQELRLAERIRSQHPRNLRQNLIDLAWIDDHSTTLEDTTSIEAMQQHIRERNAQKEALRKAVKTQAQRDAFDLLDWVHVDPKNPKDALEHWRTTHSTPWLLAALARTQPGDPAAAELIAAASQIPDSDPGYLSISYHRLRLSPASEATRRDLVAILPSVSKQGDPSSVNLFAALDAATAPTLDAWLAAAGRKPAGETDWGAETTTFTLPAVRAGPYPTPPIPQNACGTRLKPDGSYKLFDTDAAVILNTQFPLRLLAEAAQNPTLTENLRYQLAQATWARAVILDRPEVAAKMTPLLIACRAAWKPVLSAFDSATTSDERHVEGLLALMRFASTEPSVRDGEERRSGFASYDSYRQNWWCSAIPEPGFTVDGSPDPPSQGSYAPPEKPTPAAPLFLSREDLDEAKAEVDQLSKVRSAAEYFEAEALAWRHAHPNDPRNAELLGEAMRAERSSCSPDSAKTLTKKVFEALQNHYPKSEWAKKYKTWQ